MTVTVVFAAVGGDTVTWAVDELGWYTPVPPKEAEIVKVWLLVTEGAVKTTVVPVYWLSDPPVDFQAMVPPDTVALPYFTLEASASCCPGTIE